MDSSFKLWALTPVAPLLFVHRLHCEAINPLTIKIEAHWQVREQGLLHSISSAVCIYCPGLAEF